MKLDDRTASLVAVGASVAANCQACLEINATRARSCGLGAEEIEAAILIGRKVRDGAASKMDRFASRLGLASPEPHPGSNLTCDCDHLASRASF